MEHGLWAHLPLLVGATSKDSVESALQVLWRTRKTGLDPTDRLLIRHALCLQDDVDFDPLLVCLRMLIRKTVYSNIGKDDIMGLFPGEVLPELRRLLTLLLQKFQAEWRADVLINEATSPRLKGMAWAMVNPEAIEELQMYEHLMQLDLLGIHRSRNNARAASPIRG